jgi:hypothetical protein
VNSEEAIFKNQVIELLSELRFRIERLERAAYLAGIGDPYSQPPRPRKGRKPKLETALLLQRRSNLTTFLEQNWPRLFIPLRKAEDSVTDRHRKSSKAWHDSRGW